MLEKRDKLKQHMLPKIIIESNYFPSAFKHLREYLKHIVKPKTKRNSQLLMEVEGMRDKTSVKGNLT